jgi:hypothetical protein
MKVDFDYYTEDDVTDEQYHCDDEYACTPPVEQRYITLRWRMDNNLFVLIDGVCLVDDTKAVFCFPAVDIYCVVHYRHCYAV